MLTAFVLIVCLAQAPQPASLDQVTFKDGGKIEGKILVETSDYIELRIDERTVVGFAKSRVAAVVHGKATPALRVKPAAGERDQWFILHDGLGRPTGNLHETLTTDSSGRLRLGEEWQFHGKGKVTQVTLLEVATPELAPVSCFYHEWTRLEHDPRVLSDRTVRASVKNHRLVVESRSLEGQNHREYALEPRLYFPLMARESLRRRAKRGKYEDVVPVFDPGREKLAHLHLAAGPLRRLPTRGKGDHLRQLTIGDGIRTNIELQDASMRVWRREVNGPSLVAEASTKARALRYLNPDKAIYPPSLESEKNGRFAMWLPGPAWRFLPTSTPGQVNAEAPLRHASASLVLLDQIDPGVELACAADDVQRWLALLKPGFSVQGRVHARIRGRDTLRLEATFEQSESRELVRYACRVHVFEGSGHYMALCLIAPKQDFSGLAPDFDLILERLELFSKPTKTGGQGSPGKPER